MEYTYKCNACGEVCKTDLPATGFCIRCGYKSFTLISALDDGSPFNKSADSRIIEIVEEHYGSGKAMQVADILKEGE